MPFKRIDQARPFATLAVIVGGWLLVPTAAKTFLRAGFFEFTAPIPVAASRVADLKEYWSLRLHSKHELIEAGQETAHALAAREFAVQQNAALRDEITRLEGLLRLPAFPAHRPEHARVALRDFSGWWQRIIIRKGKNFGIPVGAPVVFAGGVVGKVAEVRATTAVVDLVSSSAVRLAGVVEGDARPVSYTGGVNPSFGTPGGLVEALPLDVVVTPSAAKRLVTAGFGGVFPPGLTIGTITRTTGSAEGLFQTGEVKLDERLGSLTEVTVLVPLDKP
ncbi:MAG: rod shape-determining protein MreC [Opitutaceae bacterium]|nr:rod shape-determining protein MreC [Opitutaceae bacterium]